MQLGTSVLFRRLFDTSGPNATGEGRGNNAAANTAVVIVPGIAK